jgi:DNA end-binding protein Ku
MGIGKVILHDREDIVMIAPYENAVVLYKLRPPKEIRNIEEIPRLDGKSIDKEGLKLARSLVDSMSTTLDKLDLKDRYHDALRAVIEAKIAGSEIVTVEEEEKPVVDIMTALKQSIEHAKSQKKPMEKAKGKKKAVVSKEVKPGSRAAG